MLGMLFFFFFAVMISFYMISRSVKKSQPLQVIDHDGLEATRSHIKHFVASNRSKSRSRHGKGYRLAALGLSAGGAEV